MMMVTVMMPSHNYDFGIRGRCQGRHKEYKHRSEDNLLHRGCDAQKAAGGMGCEDYF
jgi:hypothetical protein